MYMSHYRIILPIALSLLACTSVNAVENTTPPRIQKATVIRVVDGDTFVVKIDRTTETVRLIGIDTPELHHPTKTVECFGKEASQNISTLLLNKEVTLMDESLGTNRDKYGRLLRYAYLQEKPFTPVTFINAAMIKNGYAYAYTRFDFRYKEQFKQYAQNAKDHDRGLWSKNTCKGKR